MTGSSTEMLPEWKKGLARLNPTVAALLARGVDSDTATRLRTDGWTLARLQQESTEQLGTLGIRPEAIRLILDTARPPIPFETLAQVLVANRMTCCVCNKSVRGVIVHHLTEWAESHDHSEPNLGVLCLIDHDRAHTKSAHTQNLTAALIKDFKEKWQKHVQILSTQEILTASAKDFDCWWYFNRTRLLAMAANVATPLKRLASFYSAKFSGWIDVEGKLLRRNQRSSYSLEGGDGGAMYAYLKDVFDATMLSVSVFNVSNDLDRSLLKATLRVGHYIFLQGSFRFTEKTKRLSGPGQTVEIYRRANGVCVTATIDRWEATSNSAWSCYLKGIYEAAAMMRVMSIVEENGKLKIQASAIAIGAPLEGMKHREYSNAPFRRGYYPDIDEDEDYGLGNAWVPCQRCMRLSRSVAYHRQTAFCTDNGVSRYLSRSKRLPDPFPARSTLPFDS